MCSDVQVKKEVCIVPEQPLSLNLERVSMSGTVDRPTINAQCVTRLLASPVENGSHHLQPFVAMQTAPRKHLPAVPLSRVFSLFSFLSRCTFAKVPYRFPVSLSVEHPRQESGGTETASDIRAFRRCQSRGSEPLHGYCTHDQTGKRASKYYSVHEISKFALKTSKRATKLLHVLAANTVPSDG